MCDETSFMACDLPGRAEYSSAIFVFIFLFVRFTARITTRRCLEHVERILSLVTCSLVQLLEINRRCPSPLASWRRGILDEGAYRTPKQGGGQATYVRRICAG